MFRNRSCIFLICLTICGGIFGCSVRKQRSSELLIAGGEVVATSTLPVAKLIANNAVTLKVPGGHCTGALISPKLIITAAHCITRQGGPFEVFFPNAVAPNSSSQMIDSRNVVKHSLFDAEASRANQPMHDLAMLTLSESAPFPYVPAPIVSSRTPVKAIEMTVADISSRGQKAFIAGSGRTTRNSPADQLLRFAEVEAYVSLPLEKAVVFSSPGSSGCPGDSGGPVYVHEGNKLILVGVIALGNCDTTSYFVTFATDLGAYIADWIPNHSGGSETTVADLSYSPSGLVRPVDKVREVVSQFVGSPHTPPGQGGHSESRIICRDASNTERIVIEGNPAKVVVRMGTFAGSYQNVLLNTNSAYATYQLSDKLEFRINLASKNGILFYRTTSGQSIRDFSALCIP